MGGKNPRKTPRLDALPFREALPDHGALELREHPIIETAPCRTTSSSEAFRRMGRRYISEACLTRDVISSSSWRKPSSAICFKMLVEWPDP
jgi:hypothetical protein